MFVAQTFSFTFELMSLYLLEYTCVVQAKLMKLPSSIEQLIILKCKLFDK